MTTWILLRGLTRERRHWGGFEDVLRSHVPGDDVVAVDLPGSGQRRGRSSPTSVAAIVEACREDLREQAASPPYVLLALSLGGMVGIDWAGRHPGECAAAILVNSSSATSSPWHRRLRPHNLPRILGIALDSRAERRERTILALTTCHPSEPAETLVARWTAWRGEAPMSAADGLRQLWAAFRFRAPRTRPAVPVLVLAGLGDALVDPDCSWRLARDWGVELHAHPTAGHDLPLDDPHWVARRAAAWVAEVSPRSSP
jgi:pimeloyl-ACP methyl ester carboxylesterase